ncbi:DUF6350 family protein, partial [Actinacidiphila alni]|uniref:cell division protein PerM n=1 Tax=Actinacidiphila alni TaxID=380248 RepID=UPI0033CAC306
WLLGGYLAAASGAVAYAATGSVHVDPLAALLCLPLFAAAVTAAGTWAGCGWPSPARLVPYGADAVVALRAAGMAVGVVAGGGALLGGAALAWHAGPAGRTFAQLSGPMAGRLAVLLLAVALVPNLAVWGSAYALGPGFAVGVGSAVGPAGASGYPLLPGFPLVAALPGEGDGTVLGWCTLAVPAGAGVLVAWVTDRWTPAEAGPRRTALVAAGAALACGLAFAALAAASGGPLGTAALASFGPSWWATGGAALGWVLLLGAPGALALRWARTRPPIPWHTWRTYAAAAHPRHWGAYATALRPRLPASGPENPLPASGPENPPPAASGPENPPPLAEVPPPPPQPPAVIPPMPPAPPTPAPIPDPAPGPDDPEPAPTDEGS